MDHHIVSIGIGLIILILIWKFIHRNHAVVTIYEYLHVMSYQEWKSGREIKIEMEKVKQGWLNVAEIYIALDRLEDEQLVERRFRPDPINDIARRFEYKLTFKGTRIRNDRNATKKIVPWAGMKPQRL